MSKFQLRKILPFTIFPLAILSVEAQSRLPIGNTLIWWIVSILILFLFTKAWLKFFNPSNLKIMRVVKWYLVWNVFNILRGIFIVETYWDWKMLIDNGFGLLLPLIAYSSFDTRISQEILSFYVKYVFPFFFLFAFVLHTDVYGFYLVPFSFLALFFPIVSKAWRWIVFAVALFVIVIDITARSNVIKFALPILLSFIYFFRSVLSTKIFEIVRKMLIIAPILFFFLAVYGSFNVLAMDDYIKGDYVTKRTDLKGEVFDDNLKADSRSPLYVEVLQSASKFDSWWLGRSPARGNLSDYFGEGDMSGRGERGRNEAGILNVFTWTGIIGVFLYLMVFYKASFLAVNRSNNIFSKILGLFVAFHWLYSWAEDINQFTLNYFMIWFMIGLCFSESFRKMTDKEVKLWVRGIFEKKKPRSRKVIYSSPNFQQKRL